MQLRTHTEALTALQGFIGMGQLHALVAGCRGEEASYFRAKLVEMAERVLAMPKTYEQEGLGDQAIVYLHYFAGGQANWWIAERDMEAEQHQAFGLANMFGGPCDQDAELGYISIIELLAAGAELDLHFTPCTLEWLKNGSA